MRLTAPIYRLKRKARRLSRQDHIPHHAALDQVASEEGFASWSLLSAKMSADAPARALFACLRPGDLLLIGARPGHGKTLLSLELAAQAMKSGRRSVFYTLEYTERDVVERFRAIGMEPARFEGMFALENSDAICADYIVSSLAAAPRGTLVIIDYLQLLDQKRTNPELDAQVRTLKSFARATGLILAFISQVDRSYDPSRKPFPDIADIRLPNPLDLSLFNTTCFLNDGEIWFERLN